MRGGREVRAIRLHNSPRKIDRGDKPRGKTIPIRSNAAQPDPRIAARHGPPVLLLRAVERMEDHAQRAHTRSFDKREHLVDGISRMNQQREVTLQRPFHLDAQRILLLGEGRGVPVKVQPHLPNRHNPFPIKRDLQMVQRLQPIGIHARRVQSHGAAEDIRVTRIQRKK